MNKNVKIFDGSDAGGAFAYRFSAKDTLFGLAERFHTSVGAIIALNGLTEYPSAGEYILIERTEGAPHTVTPSESIRNVIDGHEAESAKIKIKNRTEYFYAGQKIFI